MTSYGMSLSRGRAELMSSDGVGGPLLGKLGLGNSPVLFQRERGTLLLGRMWYMDWRKRPLRARVRNNCGLDNSISTGGHQHYLSVRRVPPFIPQRIVSGKRWR